MCGKVKEMAAKVWYIRGCQILVEITMRIAQKLDSFEQLNQGN